MTLVRFLVGIPLSLVAVLPVGLGVQAVRRHLLPGWEGLVARLVEVVLGLTVILVVAEALGTVGWLAPGPVVISLALAGTSLWLVISRRSAAPDPPVAARVADTADRSSAGWRRTVALGTTLLVVGAWSARAIRSIQHGMMTVDTFWYHLPVAARFAQTGRTTSIQYVDSEPVTAFFPASSSLLHAIGFLLFRTDLVSTVVNLGWLALALVAAWCAGRPFGAAPATLLGAALVLGTPGMVATQPGGAYNDVAGLALLLVGVAVVLQDRPGPRLVGQDVVAGLAAGMAVGMKFTFVGPAAALCLGVVLTAPKGVRIRRTMVVLVAASITGGYWYVRNAVATGNPLPSLSIKLGPLSLPSVQGTSPTSSVSAFLFDGRAWTDNFLPGLRSSLGPVWIAVVAFALAGMLAAAAHRTDARLRMLGLVGIVSAAAYIFTPQYLVGGFGRPFFFGANVRYVSPALVVGLVLLPILLARWRSWVLGAYVLALVLTELDPASWPTGFKWATFYDRVSGEEAALALVLLAFGAVVAWAMSLIWQRTPHLRSRNLLIGSVAPLVILVGLAGVHGHYLDNRYATSEPFPALFAWPRNLHDQRLAVVGFLLQGQYPFVGLDLSNHVQFEGVRTDGGGFRPARSCIEWVKRLEAGRYDYAVIGPAPNLAEWTAAQPDARTAFTQPIGTDGKTAVLVYRLDRTRSPRTC